MLTDGCADAAAEHLARIAPRKRRYNDQARHTLARQVEEWFLQEPVEHLLGLLRPDGASARVRAAAARRFVAEWGVAQWVRQLHAAVDAAYSSQ